MSYMKAVRHYSSIGIILLIVAMALFGVAKIAGAQAYEGGPGTYVMAPTGQWIFMGYGSAYSDYYGYYDPCWSWYGCGYGYGAYQQDQASFSAVPTSGAAPLSVTFTGRNLLDTGTYLLDFGDGQQATIYDLICTQMGGGGNTCQFSTGHTYTSAGTYTARLIRHIGPANGEGQDYLIGTATITVTGGQQGQVTFSAQPRSGTAPLSVVFTSNAEGPVNFGDGTSGRMEQNCATGFSGPANCNTGSYFATHTYTQPGTFTATLFSGCPVWQSECPWHMLAQTTVTVSSGATPQRWPSWEPSDMYPIPQQQTSNIYPVYSGEPVSYPVYSGGTASFPVYTSGSDAFPAYTGGGVYPVW